MIEPSVIDHMDEEVPMKILYQGGTGELTEKKSRFIAQTFPVHSEDETLERLAEVRRQHWDARHHCWAYVIGDRHQLQRCSDDGEPQGTAGRPMLDVLLGEDVHDAMVIVTRYFGGVLLGTGGLVRAYSSAASEGLKQSVILDRISGSRLTIRTDYTGIGKIQYLLAQRGIVTENSRYTDLVELDVLVAEQDRDGLIRDLTECTSGGAQFPDEQPVLFAVHEGECILLSAQ